MQVPIRKPGTYTHQRPDPHITEAKFLELKNKLESLKKTSQPRAILEVKRLAEMGDFSDNAAYSMAKGRLRGINQRILEIEDHLKKAILIKPNLTGRIQLGSQVTVLVNNKEKTYTILGSSETDPLRGVISHNSPLGEALMNRQAGDEVKVTGKDKVISYKIISVK